MRHHKMVGWLILIVLLVIVSSGCSKKTATVPAGNDSPEVAVPVEENPALPQIACPLDGTLIEALPLRPIAVTIDNFRPARPQSGLDQADLVYEVPVEGGITRYLAIFYHGAAKTIGPVRSARPYLIDLAREWDAVYIHIGQSPQAQTYFKNNDIPHINEMYHAPGFWRDKTRKAPHNLYTSSAGLWTEISKLGWAKQTEPEALLFRSAGEAVPGTAAPDIILPYAYGKVGYHYDQNDGKYLRLLNGSPYKDLVSGVQLAAANVLVQQVTVRSFDDAGRLEVDLIGSGKAWLFSAGVVQEGTWQKDSLTRRTRFYDQSGSEMRLAVGQTWIQLIPKQMTISYK